MSDVATTDAPVPTAGPETISHRRLLLIIGALMLGMILGSLDQTVVATALPTIEKTSIPTRILLSSLGGRE
jgi:hypothetical protein